MKKGLIVLSLFDGMACGYEALKRANIPVDKYYSSEIDKYAIQIAEKNHPDIIKLGDVNDWKNWDIEKPDLIIGGSPCQGFSFAGKQLAFDDPRSRLFFTMCDIIDHYKPRLKFLENVKMKKEFLDVVSEYMGEDPILINSSLVSAQSRERYYWFDWNSPVPEDKSIYLKDVIDHQFDGEYKFMREKSKTIRCGGRSSPPGSKQKWDNIYSNKCLVVGHAGLKTYERDNRVHHINGKCPTLLSSSGGNKEKKITIDGLKWRKLTPIECERLQTLPDNYTEGVSNTQRYKMLGNGWTVEVIAHIFRSIPL